MTLSVTALNAKCCYAECRVFYSYAECRNAESIVMMNLLMLSVVMLNVIMLSVIMLNVIMLRVVVPEAY